MSAVVESVASQIGTALVATGTPWPLVYGPGGRVVSRERFIRQVHGVAATLPQAGYVINLCEDRYRFLVAFCAATLRGQANLLPTSRACSAVAAVQACHPGSYCLGDGPLSPSPERFLCLPDPLPEIEGDTPLLSSDALVAIGFTSGSTGQPAAHDKHWSSFRTSTRQNLAALQGLLDPAGAWLVATIPPQHMYGMEFSVLLPLL